MAAANAHYPEVRLQLSGKSGYEFLSRVHSTLRDKMQ
jgi:hypothetical protein